MGIINIPKSHETYLCSCCFIGLASVSAEVQKAHSIISADGRPSYQSVAQVESESDSSDSDSDEENVMFPVHNAWESVTGGAEDGKYERVITPNFSAASDDIFMRSMIGNYAQEERTKFETQEDGTKTGGEPTGRYWMTKALTELASKEVLGTHKGLSGDLLSA